MRKQSPQTSIRYNRFSNGDWHEVNGGVISESSLQLTVNGEAWLSFMCTPTQTEELATGFLYNEGIVSSLDEFEIIRTCETGDNIDVWLNRPVKKPAQWRRTSGCTGGMTAQPELQKLTQLVVDGQMPIDKVLNWMDHLLSKQELYREVRGVHCSILTDGDQILAQAEDIGRHNTLDKIAGIVLRNKIAPGFRMILTTGRISSEMLQKAAHLGAVIVVSRTSPTSMSITTADELGITLIGYARRNQGNVYSHPERLLLLEDVPAQDLRMEVHTPAD